MKKNIQRFTSIFNFKSQYILMKIFLEKDSFKNIYILNVDIQMPRFFLEQFVFGKMFHFEIYITVYFTFNSNSSPLFSSNWNYSVLNFQTSTPYSL